MAGKTPLETTIEAKALELAEYQAKLSLRSECLRFKTALDNLRSKAPLLDRTDKEKTAESLLDDIEDILARIDNEGLLDE